MTVTIDVPGASASSSKMAKKGWKCWAKWLSSVATPANDGFAYQGEFASVGSTVECEVGDVLLHVDQSASADLGIVLLNKDGKPFLKWVADANSDGRQWCGPLAKTARMLCDMGREERILWAAKFILEQPRQTPLSEDAAAYWRGVAGVPQAIAIDHDALRAERETLLARLAEINAVLGIE